MIKAKLDGNLWFRTFSWRKARPEMTHACLRVDPASRNHRFPGWKKPVSRSGAFTLAELLAVVALVAMMIGLVTMAISSIGQSQQLGLAGTTSVDMLNYARQLARSENTLTRVALISEGAEAGRVMTVLQYRRETDDWKQVERWSVMPEGFEMDLAELTLPPPNGAPLFTESSPEVILKRSTKDVRAMVLEFLPSGRPRVAANVPLVGTIRSASSNSRNFYRIVVNPSTGIPVARRPTGSTTDN